MLLYSCAFNGGFKESGWKFTPPRGDGKMVYIESEGYYEDKGGKWEGPVFAADANEFAYYRMKFKSKSKVNGHYAVFFHDADGKPIVADIYAHVYGGNGWLDNDVCFYGRENGKGINIIFQSTAKLEVKDLTVERIDWKTCADWADALYATLPPLPEFPLPDLNKSIPRSMEKLKKGGKLRIVMLGDSIVNDTFNSVWPALLQRAYPDCQLEVICSVRGSTGCWYYRENEHFKSYVADLKPDLLMVGGISQKDDIEAIREVLTRARRELGCEVLLMSGPMHDDWRVYDPAVPDKELSAQSRPRQEFYIAEEKLAKELDVAFIPMDDIWHKYLGASRKPWRWFHRDKVHADDRGKQILGRILERCFKQ